MKTIFYLRNPEFSFNGYVSNAGSNYEHHSTSKTAWLELTSNVSSVIPGSITGCAANNTKYRNSPVLIESRSGQFSCQFCLNRFERKLELANHMRTHTGERPYKCAYCDYTAHTSSNLINHKKRMHEKVAKHQCSNCGKNFFALQELKRHLDRKRKCFKKISEKELAMTFYSQNYK